MSCDIAQGRYISWPLPADMLAEWLAAACGRSVCDCARVRYRNEAHVTPRAGLCLVAVAAALVIAAPRSTRMAQRFGPKLVCGIGLAIAATCFGLYFFVQPDTPPWVVEVLLFVHGLGMGNVLPPATNAIMGAIPREKAGAGAAVNVTFRQVGGALGVAILGSILSAAYRRRLGGAAEALPAHLRGEDASDSVGGTLAAVGRTADAVQHGQLPTQAAAALPGVRDAATDAFVQCDAHHFCRRRRSGADRLHRGAGVPARPAGDAGPPRRRAACTRGGGHRMKASPSSTRPRPSLDTRPQPKE
jgi:hypothetical protein